MARDTRKVHSPEVGIEISGRCGDDWLKEIGFTGDDLDETKEFKARDMLGIIYRIKDDIEVRVRPLRI